MERLVETGSLSKDRVWLSQTVGWGNWDPASQQGTDPGFLTGSVIFITMGQETPENYYKLGYGQRLQGAGGKHPLSFSAGCKREQTKQKASCINQVLVTRPCLTLCDPLDCNPPGASVHGTFRARILEWVAIPFSRDVTKILTVFKEVFLFFFSFVYLFIYFY